MRKFIVFVITLVLLLIVPRVVNACGCQHITTVLDDYEEADLVIIARIKAVIKGTTIKRLGTDINHVTMVVEKVFKGDVRIGEELTFGQGDPILGCTWSFYEDQLGEKYLLYLYRPEKPSDPFYISTCNRSSGLESANDDLLYLENIDKVRGRTRISGVVEHDGGDDENAQVRIAGRGKTYIATTDKNGVYELYDLPPGRYSLEPVLNPGWKVDEFHLTRQQTRAEWRRSKLDLPPPNKVWFTLRAKKHFGVDIRLQLDNRVAGVVTTRDGKPLNHVCVSFVPTDKLDRLGCNVFTKSDGRFNIESVDAGSYYLLINYENIRSSHHPFPKLYYPGVPNPEAAKVFTVQFGESVEGLKLIVPTLDPTVTLEGVVRYSDGSPASNRIVRFKTPKTVDVDGSTTTETDKRGRFSLTVLKGLRGELSSGYTPEAREFATCPPLQRLLRQSGKSFLTFYTPRLEIEANENKVLELKFPVSPCR